MSGRRSVLLSGVAVATLTMCFRAEAKDVLDSGGLTFRDFATADNGASFSKGDPMSSGGPNQVSSRLVTLDTANGFARIRFDSIRIEVSLPLGWLATEDWERGVAYSADRSYRLIVWRVDFAFEGVKDAEHYAAMKSGTIRSRRPKVRAEARKLDDRSFLVVYENVPAGQGDTRARTVYDVIIARPDNAKEGVLMTLGVPAHETDRGLKLLSLLKSSLRID